VKPAAVAGAGALVLGALLFVNGAWIPVKAELAQHLLARAWARTLAGEVAAKPWPWADTWPIARLSGDALGRDLYVLADGSGRSLAFGPGHVAGTPLPGEAGTSLIGGHRDTHFAVLKDTKAGDRLLLETAGGRRQAFEIDGASVVDERTARLELAGDTPRLLLVTCYPFEALVPGGPLRYLVSARAVTQLADARAAARPE
jgi:sortase A